MTIEIDYKVHAMTQWPLMNLRRIPGGASTLNQGIVLDQYIDCS